MRKDADLVVLFRRVSVLVNVAIGNVNESEVKEKLRSHLDDRACLLVLDDVWNLDHAQAFLDILGPRCRLLLTTRDEGVANKLGAVVRHVDRLDYEDARSLLAHSAGLEVDALPPEAAGVTEECGNLPFALAQCGAVVRNGNSWRDLLDALRMADVSYFSEKLPNYEYADVFRAIEVSVEFVSHHEPW